MRFAWEDGPGRGIKAIPHSKLQLVRELFFPKYGDVFVISGPARHANLLWHWQYVPFYKYCMTLVLDMQFVPVESGFGSRRLSWRHGTVTYEWRSPLSRFDCSMFQSTIATGLFDSDYRLRDFMPTCQSRQESYDGIPTRTQARE